MHNTARNPDDRHEIFMTIISALHHAHLPTIADRSRVSMATLYNWIHGPTLNPNTRTLFAVAESLGMHIAVRRYKRRPHLVSVN